MDSAIHLLNNWGQVYFIGKYFLLVVSPSLIINKGKGRLRRVESKIIVSGDIGKRTSRIPFPDLYTTNQANPNAQVTLTKCLLWTTKADTSAHAQKLQKLGVT